MKTLLIATLLAGAAFTSMGPATAQTVRNTDWAYNGGSGQDHYSPLTQINKSNVAQLKEVWRFPMAAAGLESQPMKIGRTLYVVTPQRALVALDAATGAKKWEFDPKLKDTQPIRGLTSWYDGGKLRVVFSTQNHVYLIDPATGAPLPGFGKGGYIDVREDLRGPAENNQIYLTSPAMIYQDLIIVNGRLRETTPGSPGDVRAFSARTGKLVWTFHTIPHPGEPGAETWPVNAHITQGGANAWSGSTVDLKRGIVFVNTGCPQDDYYGGEHPGDNRFANSMIALDAKTGKRLWDFQEVHHDLWDSDSMSAPLLTTVKSNGKSVDVVVGTNKQSYIYVFDRVTGKSLFPIVETKVPGSNVPGEYTSPTQPIPLKPRPMSRRTVTEADLNDSTPEVNAALRAWFAKLYLPGQMFAPPGFKQDTLRIPGATGGAGWRGLAGDRKGVIYAAVNDTAQISRIQDNPRFGMPDGPEGPQPQGGYQNGYPHLKYVSGGAGPAPVPAGQFFLKGPTTKLHAVDLNTGDYRWTIPIDSLAGGGPTVTESGLLFLGLGGNLRAYDTDSGKVLFEQKLPGQSGLTPATYMVDGKQYVVLASGGQNAAYVAYALPN